MPDSTEVLTVPPPRSSAAGDLPWLLLLPALLVLACRGPAAAAGPEGLDRFVEKVMEEYATPGLSLAVVKDDRVVVLRGYGVRRYGTKEAVDENTLFPIA